jgi:hypothetical protein
MATFTLAFSPTMLVLQNGGRIKISDLHKKLFGIRPLLFRDEKSVEEAIDTYIACLKIEGEEVVFNREAQHYTKIVNIYEREIQEALHGAIPDMERWQLYPFKTRSNSPECYIGIPWAEIPNNDMRMGQPGESDYPEMCDFDGKQCRTGCRVSDEVLRRRGFR